MQNDKGTNPIGQSLKRQMKDFWADIAEMQLDKIINFAIKDSGPLKDLPILKGIFAVSDMHSAIQSAAFLRKYANFIGQVSLGELNEDDAKKLDAVLSSPDEIDKVIENTIIYIDRYHNEVKAKLLGKLFLETFKYHKFSVNEYNSLMFSIEQVHPVEGWSRLEDFYNYKLRLDDSTSERDTQDIWSEGARLDFQPLLMSGLLRLPSGGSYTGDLGGAFINDKGIKFYEYVVRETLK